MVEAVCDFDGVLAGEPGDPLLDQVGQGFLIDGVALHDGDLGTDLTLVVEDACQSQGQQDLDDDHVPTSEMNLPEIEVPIVPVFFFQVPDPEMDEHVQ